MGAVISWKELLISRAREPARGLLRGRSQAATGLDISSFLLNPSYVACLAADGQQEAYDPG